MSAAKDDYPLVTPRTTESWYGAAMAEIDRLRALSNIDGERVGMTAEQLADYEARLERARKETTEMSYQSYGRDFGHERIRLRGKAAGVALAIDYLRGYRTPKETQ